MRGALADVRVLDLTRVMAGPFCTMTLADLGADVWKIEHPVSGDETRSWRPPEVAGESTYYLAVNRNKKSVALDLKNAEGARVARALAQHADVLVANFLPGALERFGLDYASLSNENPRLVHCTITGYGYAGSRAQQAGYDFAIQAESGLMAMTGEASGEPVKFGVAIADLLAGMNASQAILAALFARERSGRGQSIDIALLDSAIAATSSVASAALNARAGKGRYGNAHPSIVPYQTFATRDGTIVVACGNDRQFGDLCTRVIGRPELASDARFASNVARVAHRADLVPLLAAAFAALPTANVIARLQAANVPSGEIRSVLGALGAPEVAERGMIAEVQHPSAGRIAFPASPLHLLGTPPQPPRAPPAIGEHTRDVLRAVLGLADVELEELERSRAIATNGVAAAPGPLP